MNRLVLTDVKRLYPELDDSDEEGQKENSSPSSGTSSTIDLTQEEDQLPSAKRAKLSLSESTTQETSSESDNQPKTQTSPDTCPKFENATLSFSFGLTRKPLFSTFTVLNGRQKHVSRQMDRIIDTHHEFIQKVKEEFVNLNNQLTLIVKESEPEQSPEGSPTSRPN